MRNPTAHGGLAVSTLMKLKGIFYPIVAKIGGRKSQGAEGDAVVIYCEPLATRDLESSGFPAGEKRWPETDPILKGTRVNFSEGALVRRLFNTHKGLISLGHLFYATDVLNSCLSFNE